MQGILNLSLEDLAKIFKRQGFAAFASRQIFNWIYKKEVFDFERMTDLPKRLRHFLKQNFYVISLVLIRRQISFDGTQKFLLGLSDQQGIESVIIPTARRITACISTQVGCRFACRFCASGQDGFKRNMTTAEIIEQAIYLRKYIGKRINNIVFMGVGEPLDNYDNVLGAIRILNSSYSLNIGARKMTISTCGIIPAIKRLAQENIQIELSISLHAANNQLRTYLMPINKKYTLEKLIQASRDYFNITKRQVTFEYILIDGINSDLRQARKLTELLVGLDAKVNLIPASPFKNRFSAPNKLDMLLFRDILIKAGIPATLRRWRGVDIQAACGQLRLFTKIN